MAALGKTLLLLGLVIAGAGLLLILADRLPPGLLGEWLGRLRLGRLPGDIVVDRPGFKLYVPWVTCLVISAVISLLLWLFRR